MLQSISVSRICSRCGGRCACKFGSNWGVCGSCGFRSNIWQEHPESTVYEKILILGGKK